MVSHSELVDLFKGRRVLITDFGGQVQRSPVEGICKTVHETPGDGNFDIELEGGSRFGFAPEVVIPDSVEGGLRALNGGRRKIQMVLMKIVVRHRGDDYHASLEDHPEIWGCGATEDAAIGDLIRSHQRRFGMIVEYH